MVTKRRATRFLLPCALFAAGLTLLSGSCTRQPARASRPSISFEPISEDRMCEKDIREFKRLRRLYSRGETARVNRIIRVERDDITFSVRPVSPKFLAGVVPQAEITITNISRRTLTILGSDLQRTSSGLTRGDHTQIAYRLSSWIRKASWCRVLDPGQKVRIPVTFMDYDSRKTAILHPGTYKILLTLSCPQYKDVLSGAGSAVVIKRAACTFEVL